MKRFKSKNRDNVDLDAINTNQKKKLHRDSRATTQPIIYIGYELICGCIGLKVPGLIMFALLN